ncbi:MAG: hypothetical protein JNN10_09415 [Sphingopyxis sp.]|uniref:hypothetical protein n=1 Tax=Sphingopyxis sp. TaxID=1908224 RepID=UPI001A4FF7D9|nr:hypothetical protein [Sphingopyxis sp.]MBL9066497.1 hypothetical protein [Sphingopyxis sp.]
MPTTHDDPVGDDTRQHVADLRLAAAGDAPAQLRLSHAARAMVVSGEADEIGASIEGLTYARLAASQGVPEAVMLAADHCSHLAKVYSDCGAESSAADWAGQAIGLLEIATDLLPAANAANLMQTLNSAADMASPEIMALAKFYRSAFAPAFGADAFA